MKTDLFQSWLVECSTFTASSFRVLNNSAGISSFPLALFVVMLPKAHLTSHSRSRWVTTPPWLSRSLRLFLHSCSVYSFHLFLISCASFRALPFLFFMMPFSAWNVPLISLVLLKRYLLLLLLSHFSRVRLCATPQMAAHQAPLSLGFSRQEHWSGLPFPSPAHESEKWKWSRSVLSDS